MTDIRKETDSFSALVATQGEYFLSGQTRSASWRACIIATDQLLECCGEATVRNIRWCDAGVTFSSKS